MSTPFGQSLRSISLPLIAFEASMWHSADNGIVGPMRSEKRSMDERKKMAAANGRYGKCKCLRLRDGRSGYEHTIGGTRWKRRRPRYWVLTICVVGV